MNENRANNHLTIALAGNPNAGKTTLFNSLTGLNQKVANYPGVTVERKEGIWNLGDTSATLIDLPGLYSLDATSLDEQIARDVITGKVEAVPKPDVIVSVVDATNLERNLYLATQLFEFGVPVVIALTMIDVFEKRKHEIDIDRLSQSLGVPVIAVNAKAERGKSELAGEVLAAVGTNPKIPYELNGGRPDGDNAKIFARYNFISNAVQESVRHNDKREHRISETSDRVTTHKAFGLAILMLILLQIGEVAGEVLAADGTNPKIPYELNGRSPDGDNAKIVARYNFISNAVQESVRHKDKREHRISETIDRVLTHKVFGLAILILILL